MRQIDSVKNSRLYDHVLEEARKITSPGPTTELPMPLPDARPFHRDEGDPVPFQSRQAEANSAYFGPAARTEAIILQRLRPPYLIRNDIIEIVGDYDSVELIRENRRLLENSAKSVGRVDLMHHSTFDFVGTGWLIDDDIVVTNRHVAEIFAEADWSGGYGFRNGSGGTQVEALVDFVRQHATAGLHRKAFVTEVLFISAPREPDFAFMRIKKSDDIEPLRLSARKAAVGLAVAAIGYPAWDGDRNDPAWMAELFGGIYDVKRFSPGFVTGSLDDGIVLRGDYTSLGGNSGSAVCELEEGEVVGLHFAGVFREANYMVSADVVDAARRRLQTRFHVSLDVPAEAPVSRPSLFEGRTGYDAEFLGSGELAVPLPQTGRWSDELAPVTGTADHVLRYEHFSTIQCASRRLPLLTAVNIDGEVQRKLDRKGDWKLDGRLDPAHQIGNELYVRNALDRGHMVRRRDPGWGSTEEAVRAEKDTFHYTNSVPQHEDLNQKTWVGLEDYILSAVETSGFKASVFTGPVFRDSDKLLKHQPGAEDIRIPEEFWKVVVMVDAETRKLHVTAYVLSHGPLIRNMTEAPFLFGKHETYQVPVSLVEGATDLDFGTLGTHDPLGQGREGPTFARISAADDLILS